MAGGPPKNGALEGPVCHHGSPSDSTPLIWVGDSESDSSSLLMRVAAHGAGAPSPAASSEGLSGAFGARQRGWLTRLTWAPSSARERRLVLSDSFLGADQLQHLAGRVHDQGYEIPHGFNGVVDGLTPTGEVVFYALFEGPGPWTPVSIMPVPPPFDGLSSPLLLGDVRGRLSQWSNELESGRLDATARELIDAALVVVTGDRR